MGFLKYSYYRYFLLQQRVGNADIAEFLASVFVAWLLSFTILAMVMIIEFFWGVSIPIGSPKTGVLYSLALMLLCYLAFVPFGRHARIVAQYQAEPVENRRRGTLYVVLWPILVFCSLMGVMGLYVLRNSRL
jgi:hypothetical protein